MKYSVSWFCNSLRIWLGNMQSCWKFIRKVFTKQSKNIDVNESCSNFNHICFLNQFVLCIFSWNCFNLHKWCSNKVNLCKELSLCPSYIFLWWYPRCCIRLAMSNRILKESYLHKLNHLLGDYFSFSMDNCSIFQTWNHRYFCCDSIRLICLGLFKLLFAVQSRLDRLSSWSR